MSEGSGHEKEQDGEKSFTGLILGIFVVVFHDFVHKGFEILFSSLILAENLVLGRKGAHIKVAELHFDDIISRLELIVLSDGAYTELVVNVDLNDIFFG
jgi:hypothetical protein